MRRTFLVFLSLILTTCFFNSKTWALGMEGFGNSPLNAQNYLKWPGIMPVINHHSRVYNTWVNGNEHFYYSGKNQDLNQVLKKFSETELDVREVVLRPKPGIVHSLNREKTIEYNWKLQIVGGIASSMSKLDQGSKIWRKHPVMTVYVGGNIEFDKIKIPEGVKVLELSDLEKRYSEALSSQDQTVRGWGTGQLAALDPYSKTNLKIVAKLLQDKEDWVRLNAAGAIALYGLSAKSEIPVLREALKTENKRLKTRLQESIQKIENSKPRIAEEKEYQELRKKISQFCQSLNK